PGARRDVPDGGSVVAVLGHHGDRGAQDPVLAGALLRPRPGRASAGRAGGGAGSAAPPDGREGVRVGRDGTRHPSASLRLRLAGPGETEQVPGDPAHLDLLRTLGDPVPAVVTVDVLERLVAGVPHAAV